MAPIPSGTCQPPGGRLTALDLSSMEGEEIHPCWNKRTFWVWICVSCNIIHQLQNALGTTTAFLTGLLLIRELMIRRKAQPLARVCGVNWSYHMPGSGQPN